MTDAKTLTVVTIVPAEKASDSRAHFVLGTKILLSDGSELSARDVTISTHKDGLWIASIEVLMELAPAFVAQAGEVHAKAPAAESPPAAPEWPKLAYPGVDSIPAEGTWLLEPGDRVVTRRRFTDEARSAMRLVESLINAGDLVLVHDKWNEGKMRFVGAPMPSNEVSVAVQGAE